jgi:glycine/D-amino acid oxidase-like deaminating enzyme
VTAKRTSSLYADFFFIIGAMKNLWEATAEPSPEAGSLAGNLSADVVVIGAGFTGCAAALRLAQASTDVCVIEAETIGYGASGRNVGLVNTGLWVEPEKIEAELGRENGQHLNDMLMRAPDVVFGLIEKHSISCESTRAGTLYCAHAPSGFRKLERRTRQLIARGTLVQLLSSDEVREMTGSPTLHGALLDRRAGTIQPLSYVRGLARAAIKAGATFYTRSPVDSISHDGRKWRVVSGQGSIVAGSVILATNAYTTALDTGTVPSFVPIEYFQFATKPLREDLRDDILPKRQGVWDTATVMSSFRMDQGDRLIIGGIGRLDGLGASVHQRWARRKLTWLFPMLEPQDFEFGWFGRIALTYDHLPRIVRIGNDALTVHGYNGRGIGPGTIFGTALADYFLTGRESVLPLPIVDQHRESFRLPKSCFYEVGATVFHLMSARVGR